MIDDYKTLKCVSTPTFTNRLCEWLVITVRDNIGLSHKPLKNEPQTMMTFVSRVHHKALHDQFKVGIYPEVRKILSTETDQVQRRGRLPQA